MTFEPQHSLDTIGSLPVELLPVIWAQLPSHFGFPSLTVSIIPSLITLFCAIYLTEPCHFLSFLPDLIFKKLLNAIQSFLNYLSFIIIFLYLYFFIICTLTIIYPMKTGILQYFVVFMGLCGHTRWMMKSDTFTVKYIQNRYSNKIKNIQIKVTNTSKNYMAVLFLFPRIILRSCYSYV